MILWYIHFKGKIEKEKKSVFKIYIPLDNDRQKKVIIIELTIGMWTDHKKKMEDEHFEVYLTTNKMYLRRT